MVPADVMKAVEENDLEMITNFQEWKKDLVETAENILFYEKERYIDLPERLLSMVSSLMVKYINSLRDEVLREKLNAVIEGGGGTEKFEEVLFQSPNDLDQWADFTDESVRYELARWLNSVGIEPLMGEGE